MIVVVQRVARSTVSVNGEIVGEISAGLNILLGIVIADSEEDIDFLVDKITKLRMFSDAQEKMNLSIMDINGSALVIPQFTLAANVRKGRRPSFDLAESPDLAAQLYKQFVEKLSTRIPVETGVFAAHMNVEISNDGPVTFIIDSKNK